MHPALAPIEHRNNKPQANKPGQNDNRILHKNSVVKNRWGPIIFLLIMIARSPTLFNCRCLRGR